MLTSDAEALLSMELRRTADELIFDSKRLLVRAEELRKQAEEVVKEARENRERRKG